MKGGPKGNQHAAKLKTPEIKLEAYNQYCQHIAEGIPKEAWCFEHPDLTITWETMENYMDREPNVFPPVHIQMAKCKSYKKWFKVVADSATGDNEKANTASLQMIMRNKFRWDKQEMSTNMAQTDVRKFLDHIENPKIEEK
jgi:hypothetical protein